ncbi:MAG: tetratricopeptide repeat protein, partial [Nitrospira sp.]|nr:tetratricopeptide repeat protein [Nitrospira sp.]
MKQNRNLLFLYLFLMIVAILTLVIPAHSAKLQAHATENVDQFLFDAQELLEQFQFHAGLIHLDEALQHFPASSRLHKKRGDVLMILRHNQDALASYRQALTLAPDWIDGHWALWALLNRLNVDPVLELDSLFHIADLDSSNPLAQIRVARKLRELQRFEESVVYFRRAVEIDSLHLAYRLFLARALFDIRDTDTAQQEVQWVLSHASPGSPVRIAAQNLLQTVEGGTVDIGSRSDFFETTKQPYGEEGKDYKRWALTRGQAWQFMEAENFSEAESTWRKVLTLDPEDDLAHYNLGLTLLKLEKYEEAIVSLQASFQKSKQPHFYPDAIFQIGQAFAKLEKWGKAIVQYQQVLDIQYLKEQDFYALNFPALHVVEAALQEVRTHATNIPESQMVDEPAPTPHRPEPSIRREEEPLTISSPDSSQNLLGKSQTPLRILPLSVDVVRGWFRQLVTAKAIGQDDLTGGFLEYIPLDPGDTFPPNQPRIYLIFALTTPPADAKQITTQWVAEQVEKRFPNTVMGTDAVLVGLNDSTGYFFLDRPEEGWPVGTYRIDLFVGEDVSASTYVAEVRFQIQSDNTQ